MEREDAICGRRHSLANVQTCEEVRYVLLGRLPWQAPGSDDAMLGVCGAGVADSVFVVAVVVVVVVVGI